MKTTSNQRKRRAHKRRKHREMLWNAEPDPIRHATKGRTRSAGRAFAREMRDKQFTGGTSVTVETSPLGNLNSTGTRVVTPKFCTIRTGRTWIRKGIR